MAELVKKEYWRSPETTSRFVVLRIQHSSFRPTQRVHRLSSVLWAQAKKDFPVLNSNSVQISMEEGNKDTRLEFWYDGDSIPKDYELVTQLPEVC